MATRTPSTTTDIERPIELANIARIAAPTILRIARERHPELFAGSYPPKGGDRVNEERLEETQQEAATDLGGDQAAGTEDGGVAVAEPAEEE